MMNKKTKGFSLAELLISLMVISLVLSAAIPSITKRMAGNREYIWRWVNQNNSAYFGVGANQSVIIGNDGIPLKDSNFQELIENNVTNVNATNWGASQTEQYAIESNYTTGTIDAGNLMYSNDGDKLIILKKTVQNNNSNFLNSHISFYTMANNTDATINDLKYAGRLAMDEANIALGIGSLQSLNPTNVGENTALGHLALLRDYDGIRNTAVGRKVLLHNTQGNYNTGIGYGALYTLEQTRTKRKDNEGYSSITPAYNDINSENTAVGSLAAEKLNDGEFNTAIGSQALRLNEQGSYNTVIGHTAMTSLSQGDYNTAIGDSACNKITSGNYNICLGYQAGNSSQSTSEDNYGLYIGTGVLGDVDTTDISQRSSVAPLISGHTRYYTDGTNTYDKELVVNARKVEFRPYDNSDPTFVFHSKIGNSDSGYAETSSSSGRTGIAIFNLRDTGGQSEYTSVTTEFAGYALKDYTNISNFNITPASYDKTANIFTYDPHHYDNSTHFADINLNDYLLIDFPPLIGSTTDSGEVAIISHKNYALTINDYMKIYNTTGGSDEGTFSLSPYNLSLTDMQLKLTEENNTDNTYIQITDKSEENKVIIKSSGIFLQGNNKSSNYTSIQPQKIYSQELTLADNNYQSGNVAESINDLYEKVEKIQQQVHTYSDERLKNISGDNTAGLKEINALEVKNYTYKNDKEKTPHVGVIAQQLQKIFPNSVFEGNDGYLRIKTEEIFYAMVNSIKELCAQIQDLTAKITGLDKRITELENKNKILEEQNKAFEKRLEKLEKKAAK